jgi:dihydrofolate reductase
MEPKVTMIMVMSASGIVAQKEIQNSFEWNSPEDREQFLKRIHEIGAVIMGSNTYRSIGGNPYQEIEFFVMTRHPERFPAKKAVRFVQGEVKEICKQVANRGIKQIALLGGPKTNTQFINHGLVDDIYLTIEPLIMQNGMHIVDQLSDSVPLTLESTETLNSNGTILLHYLVKQ